MHRLRSWSCAMWSSVVRRMRHPAWLSLGLLAAVALAALFALANRAQAATTYKLTLDSEGAHSAVSLSAKTCAAALSTLDAESTTTRYALGVAPSGFPGLDVTGVTITTNASTGSCTTLVLHGTATVFSKSVPVLVVGTWSSASATTPTFSVAFDLGSVGLDQLLTSSGTNVAATFSHVWLAATTASGGSTLPVTSTASTGALSEIREFFTGVHGSTVPIPGSGLGFVGDLSTQGDLATALGKLGVSNVQLTGDLVAQLSTFSPSTPPSASAGFNVTATFGLAIPDLPGWLTFPGTAFTLSVSGSSSGSWSVSLSGKATVKLPPDTASAPFTATFSISKAGASTPVTVGLSVDMGKLSNAFGVSWLTLTTTKLTWTVSTSTLTAALRAKMTLGSAPSTVHLTATVKLSTATGATATLSLQTASNTLSTTALAADLGLSLPAHTPTLTLEHLVFYLKIPKSGGSVTVAAEATATLTIGSKSYAVSFLLRDEGTSLLVAARTRTAFTLDQLDSSIPSWIDVSMTHLAVVFSTSTLTLKSTALDTATKTYFEPLYCASPSTTCSFTVKVKAGVTIQAAVGLPTSVKQMVCKLVVSSASSTCLTGPVTIDGHIPLFTSSTFGLTIALPTLDTSGSVKRLTLSLSLSLDASTHSVAVSASGDMVLLAPSADVSSTTNGNCPSGVTRTTTQATDICLTLDVSGTLAFKTGAVTVTFSAVVTASTGWRLPHPVTWLTLDHLAGSIGIKAGGATGVGLTIGVAGTFALGGTTLGFALHVALTPEAPWVDLLGFKVRSTNGIGRTQIADLYDDVTGSTLTPSELPPLALKDLLFEYAQTTDSKLGLCQGLHISADLVITNGHWSQGTYTAPTSVTCGESSPSRSTACVNNKSSCLASVLITIGPTGFVGKGYLTGWSAGPVELTPTTLDVTITKTEIEIHISGGGKLLTPVKWPHTGSASPEWLGGTITLTVGTSHLHLAASGDIGLLHGSVSSTGTLSTLENPFSNLASWFTTTVKGALETAGNHIKSAMTTVGTTVSAWYTTYVASTGNQLVGDIQNAFSSLQTSAPPSWQTLEAVFARITSAISSWNNAVNSATLSFLDITANGIFNDTLHGIHVAGWTVCIFGHCFTVVPGFTIPGICSYVTTVAHSPLCTTSTQVSGAQQEYAAPTVTSHLTGATLTLPTGATDKTLVTRLHAIDPTGDPTSPTITCAMSTENYSTGTESDTSLQVDTLGNTVTIDGPKPSTLGNSTDKTSNDKTLGQHTLDSLYTGTNQGTCTLPTSTLTLPTLSIGLLQSTIYRGGTLTAVVRASSTVTSVTITWGDGSPASQAAYTATTKVYRASHVYTEKGTFTVTASATVSSGTAPSPVTTTIRVIDAPPHMSKLSVSPSTIDVMQSVTVSGSLTNPDQTGLPVTATITWGDGSTTQETLPSTGAFSFRHIYERLVPSGVPAQTEPIEVVLTDSDGTTTSATSLVTVNDVPPTGLISPTSGGIVASHGTVFTHTATKLTWTSEVTDVSPLQGFMFTFDWGDGTAEGRGSVTAPTPSTPNAQHLYTYPLAAGSVSHEFARPCLYTVTTTATDDDTLSEAIRTPVVVTAPLGFTPTGPGYWHEQFAAAAGKNEGGQVPASTLGCYLEIAQYLSPQLGANLTATTAASILEPSLGHLSEDQKLAAQLRRQLLTVLLDFSNGSWNWTQPVGAGGATLQALVQKADEALTSGAPQPLRAALDALLELQGTSTRAQLTWSPSDDGIFSFPTLNATTTETQTFTLTSAAGTPLPPVTVRMTGSSAFTITDDTCPTGTRSTGPTSCEVTVQFAPGASDTSYGATLTVGANPPAAPVIASFTLSGTSS